MAGPCARRWVFTLNKYMDEDCSCLLEELNAKKCHFAVVGKEVGEGRTPHLQGFAYFKQKVRFNSVKKRFGSVTHVQVATSSDSANNRYCSKGKNLLLWVGEPGNGPVKKPRVCTLVSEIARKAVDTPGWTPRDMVKSDPERYNDVYNFYSQRIQRAYKQRLTDRALERRPKFFEGEELHPWQRQLWSAVMETQADCRTIMWITDEQGNSGKSWFIDYIKTQLSTRHVAAFHVGTCNDVLHQWEGQGIVFFDLPNDLQATSGVMAAMEQIKKG